jgi:hypothetical protein
MVPLCSSTQEDADGLCSDSTPTGIDILDDDTHLAVLQPNVTGCFVGNSIVRGAVRTTHLLLLAD